MITKLIIKNFKKIREQTYEFSDFDLLVGQNNSGKSTVLQALAIWQYCVDEFHRSRRKGSRGIQIVLPNFTALPVPEFNLLWTERTERRYPEKDGSKTQEYIYIEISLEWRDSENKETEFGILLRYQTPQSVYAIPKEGWQRFKELDNLNKLPKIVYVPPFSGIEPNEIWYDDGIVRKHVGKAQPGSVIRNLLFRVIDKEKQNNDGKEIQLPVHENKSWEEIASKINEWFGAKLNAPDYQKGVSTEIKVTFEPKTGKVFDIIAGGSGFHQILTLMAFLYGYSGITTILFDEPDAHLHVNLQRTILNYLKTKTDIQFIIATHAEEFIKGVDIHTIISVLSAEPRRVQSKPPVITALSDVDNLTIVRTSESPFILYVEGEDDERMLNAWASTLDVSSLLNKFYIKTMGGTSKQRMKEYADKHFDGLKQIIPGVSRIILFDYDIESDYHPEPENPVVFEWGRKNIENYLLIPAAWLRAIRNKLNIIYDDLLFSPYKKLIENFFGEQNLALPKNSTWENVKANIFEIVDGKKILFEMNDSLFQQILKKFQLKINRESVSFEMIVDEIHKDIKEFFRRLEKLANEKQGQS
jgi:AAA15 family ATPase/GTPase